MSQPTQAERRRSGLLLATLVPSFYLAEWLLVAATASSFTWFRIQGYSNEQIWLLFWVANLLISAAFITCNDLLGVDITLMQGLRKLTTATLRRSIGIGILFECTIFIRLLLWDGPCQLLIYWRARLPSAMLQVAFLIVASGIQMFVWAQIYALGYDGIGELLSNLNGRIQ